jgi:phosphate transport system permease protein
MAKSPSKPFTPDSIFKFSTAAVAFAIIVIIFLTLFVLVRDSLPVLTRFGFGFVTGVNWSTIPGQESYGVLPYILGTVVTSAIAILFGVPISLGIAIFLSEMAVGPIRTVLSQLVELLAAVPSVVYGLWGFLVMRFWVQDYFERPLSAYFGSFPTFQGAPFGLDIFTAGIILTIMIIPTISVVSKEVMIAVPNAQREAAYSIGATRWETIRIGVLGYARSGLFGATILGLGRAVGETMAVLMVIGNAVGPAAIPTSLLKPGSTLSSVIAGQFNEADPTSLHPAALVGAGLVLFGLAATINVFAQLLVWKVLKVKSGPVE